LKQVMAAHIQTTHASIPSTVEITATNERGEQVPVQISGEHPLTLYFDKKELLTIMTLGAQPEALALGCCATNGWSPTLQKLQQFTWTGKQKVLQSPQQC